MHRQRLAPSSAFTLIELLIVIAIIAILALIAVPNFLEAQVRAKVSKVHADMRSVTVAIEAYTVDWGRAPIGRSEGYDNTAPIRLWPRYHGDQAYNAMTTPVAYISSPPDDPFVDKTPYKNIQNNTTIYEKKYQYQYWLWTDGGPDSWAPYRAKGYLWYLRSTGPSRSVRPPNMLQMVRDGVPDMVYDSSNGTMSIGLIVRTNKGAFTGDR